MTRNDRELQPGTPQKEREMPELEKARREAALNADQPREEEDIEKARREVAQSEERPREEQSDDTARDQLRDES